jgi:sugar/nucleoside kinase (ribokinase family)
LVRDIDALYINFISGYELNLETTLMLRRGFANFIYADLHSLFLAKEPDGTRVPRPLPQAPTWFSCFNVVQLNEDEMAQLGPDPLAIAADALRQGCTTVCVTLGPRGAAYFTGNPIRTARIPAPPVHAALESAVSDPTGSGDVLGGATVAALLGGAPIEEALRIGTQMGTRNLSHRGATGLRDHLLGKLSIA